MKKKTKLYIGMATSQHDPAIAILNSEGEILFAEATERSSKNKRAWNIVPDQIGPIETIIDKYFMGINEVILCASWSSSSLRFSPYIFIITYLRKKFGNKLSFSYLENSSLRLAMYKAPSNLRDMFLNIEHRVSQKNQDISLSKVGVDHHLAHAYTAVSASNFSKALCVIVDGMGEGSSTAIFELKNEKLNLVSKKSFLNMASLGLFYGHVCEACGFDPIKGEEWKVMGLAPYGKKDDEIYNILTSLLSCNENGFVRNRKYSEIISNIFKPKNIRNEDLAFTAQLVFEEKLLEFLNILYAKYPHQNLILSGGCALNSAANGKIIKSTPFENLQIPMAPGDDGNAIGAALSQWKHDNDKRSIPRSRSPYLGSEISTVKLKHLKKFSGLKYEQIESDRELCRKVASLLAEEKIIAWVQGRAEFGPRSLGNRSILADPRKKTVKDVLNERVKFREEFRPFAPSILTEFASEYFEEDQDSPYMDRTLTFKKFDAPGVVHTNNTGRLQTVTKELNSKYHQLIQEFYNLTNVPILLNTSFNVMGRPIVHDIEDAIGVFMLSGIDILVIENTIFYKTNID